MHAAKAAEDAALDEISIQLIALQNQAVVMHDSIVESTAAVEELTNGTGEATDKLTGVRRVVDKVLRTSRSALGWYALCAVLLVVAIVLLYLIFTT